MTDQRRRNHVSADGRRHAPEFAEALGLLSADLLVEVYGDSTSRSEVFGGFTLAQWLTTSTGERPTSSTESRDSSGRDAHKACRNGGTMRRNEGLFLETFRLGDSSNPGVGPNDAFASPTSRKGEPKEGAEDDPNHEDS